MNAIAKMIPRYLLASSCFASLVGCATMQSEPYNGQFMVYVSSESGHKDIYLSDLSGKNARALTHDVAEDAHPRLTFDGRVVFASKRTGTWQIYIMDRNGDNVKALTTTRGENNYRPYPSPDGRVVFISDRYLKPQIYSVNADGSDLQRISQGDFHYDYPVVAEDGHIYYTTSKGSKWDIWKMAPDGSRARQITHIPQNIQEIAVVSSNYKDYDERFSNVSPMIPFYGMQSQNRLIFSALNETGTLGLYRVNEDGTEFKRISQQPMHVSRSPVLLRNGQIVFTSDRNGSTDIWSMYPDGKLPRQVISQPAYESTS